MGPPNPPAIGPLYYWMPWSWGPIPCPMPSHLVPFTAIGCTAGTGTAGAGATCGGRGAAGAGAGAAWEGSTFGTCEAVAHWVWWLKLPEAILSYWSGCHVIRWLCMSYIIYHIYIYIHISIYNILHMYIYIIYIYIIYILYIYILYI